MSQSMFSIEEHIASFLKEVEDDYVGLWQISGATEDFFGPGEEAREQALEIVNQLILRGLSAGNLTRDGGFVPWPDQDPASVVARVRQEWIALGTDPSINDIAWFWTPPS